MCFRATDYLDSIIKSEDKVFEYGSGGSTIYFGQRAREVVSVEHDSVWYHRVREELEARMLSNVNYALVEPKELLGSSRSRISDPLAYISDDENYVGKSFEAYARAIESFPDDYFDMVVVDGRSRPSCLMHSMRKVRVGGLILLDQSERSYYLAEIPALRDPKSWSSKRFMGPQPFYLHFTEAAFFTRRQ